MMMAASSRQERDMKNKDYERAGEGSFVLFVPPACSSLQVVVVVVAGLGVALVSVGRSMELRTTYAAIVE